VWEPHRWATRWSPRGPASSCWRRWEVFRGGIGGKIRRILGRPRCENSIADGRAPSWDQREWVPPRKSSAVLDDIGRGGDVPHDALVPECKVLLTNFRRRSIVVRTLTWNWKPPSVIRIVWLARLGEARPPRKQFAMECQHLTCGSDVVGIIPTGNFLKGAHSFEKKGYRVRD
jgi:hypothetical protein